MVTLKQRRRRGRWSLIIGTLLAALTFGAVFAYADLQQVDGDLSTTGLENSVNLGTVAGGSPQNTSAQVAIKYNNPAHLPAGSSVTFEVNTAQTDLPAGYSVSDVTVNIPNPWDDTAGPSGNGKVGATSGISFTAPTAPGSYTYTVKWKVKSGPTCLSDTPSCLTDAPGGGPAFTINLEVAAGCTPSYSATFMPPFDGVYPGSNLITNTMKNGRTVPVKTTIIDNCTNAAVTNLTGESVSILVAKNPSTSSTSPTDPVESYADAGSSSAGSNLFRWSTDGYWIYNLDSKALGLVTSTTYKVNIYVNATLASGYALLTPVK